ncbi:alpha-mannosidase [Lyngbya confervoides]|uniref:Alpha-mannosidase n=1 Tax=Lyngbya confervoides BDU141951 TaxID=1574623 RepID=A0ABD4T0Q0_9CYAN|nr:alpha-mannosidase [Lyngbya confervoides]MCM1982154.1 alpha-mannosidase [Lyngbya confervoides BDU141951]
MSNPPPLPPDLESICHRLRGLTQRDIVDQWRVYLGEDLPLDTALSPQHWQHWRAATLNHRRHIAWDRGRQPIWLGQQIVVPADLDGYPLAGLTLRLDLTWWADLAQIYVQGQLIQVGDLYDCFGRILLSSAAQPGAEINVAIRLVSPGHDPGALVRSLLWFEPEDVDQPDPGMIADELEILASYVQEFRPEDLPQLQAMTLDWTQRGQLQGFQAELARFRQGLAAWGDWLKTRRIYWTGHAHLDMAWLWPVSETWTVAERTFASVLSLMADFPELRFCHSSPALYDWIERHRPEQFAQIQEQVAAGRWEVAAGLWIEPEFNLISGESLVRQVLYGQRYVQEKFGAPSTIAWLPDSFGFCWQLPQVLRQGGVDYFVTTKLRWNDTTEFPHCVFKWRSPDGTEIDSLMLPPIGTRIDPVKMTEFGRQWEKSTGSGLSYWLPGLGDHGGGPTRDMLEVARRWDRSPVIPTLQPSTAVEFCQAALRQIPQPPVWENELYLEFHRGCYTSHADQKRYNRQCESALMEAELFAAIATLIADQPYPKQDLEQAWKQVLFNQFHDILPGSSIPEVFQDANQDWAAALGTGQRIRDAALRAIGQQIHCPPPANSPEAQALVVFNSLNWDRSGWVRTQIPNSLRPGNLQVVDDQGTPTSTWVAADHTLWFWIDGLPSIGYRIYWAMPAATAPPPAPPPDHWQLENEHLQVTLDPTTGTLARIYDKVAQRDCLRAPGNELQFFQDQGQYWDAWNIDPHYAEHRLPNAEVTALDWIRWHGPEQRIRVTLKFQASQFIQDYVLVDHCPYLTVETTVDWQTDHVLVKAAFPLTLCTDRVTCDMPCGAIQRPTLPNPKPLEAWQTAKWEIPALHWADLSEADQTYGVSLLNDCKHGYDAQPSQIRITLLRGSTWPDPRGDRGYHAFRYALYPHGGTWQQAQTTQRGYELNRPLLVQWGSSPAGSLPPQQSFLSLPPNLMLMAFKQSEADNQHWILRCYESQGTPTDWTGTLHGLNLSPTARVDGLEQPNGPLPERIEPWQIVAVQLASNPGC